MSQAQSPYPQNPGQVPSPHGVGPVAAPPGVDYPGKTLGIVGLVLSFFTALVGFVISIVALQQSRKAGYKNTPALVGVIIGIVSTVIVIISVIAVFVIAANTNS